MIVITHSSKTNAGQMAKCLFPKYKTTARNPLKDNIWELAAGKTHLVTKIISKGKKHFRINARSLEVHDYNLVKSRPTHALGMVMYR